jgi:hypothetical protein
MPAVHAALRLAGLSWLGLLLGGFALGGIRRDHPALWRGARSTLFASTDTHAYTLGDGTETVYVALNRGDAIAPVSGMPLKGNDLLTGAKIDGPDINLQVRSAVIVMPE